MREREVNTQKPTQDEYQVKKDIEKRNWPGKRPSGSLERETSGAVGNPNKKDGPMKTGKKEPLENPAREGQRPYEQQGQSIAKTDKCANLLSARQGEEPTPIQEKWESQRENN